MPPSPARCWTLSSTVSTPSSRMSVAKAKIEVSTSGSVCEFVRAWPAKTEQDKDAGRPRTSRYVADRGRSHTTVCSRPGTQRNSQAGPLRLAEEDRVDLDLEARQVRLHGRPRGKRLGEEFLVDVVHRREVLHVA